MAGAGDCLRRSRVARDHDTAVGGVKAVSKREVPSAMGDGESTHGNIRVFVNNSRMNLMRVDVIRLGVSVLQAVDTNVDVFHIGRLNVACHAGDSRWAVEFQRSGTAFHGGREIEIRQTGGVVGMQVRGENDFEVLGRERVDVFVAGGSGGASHHSGAEIDEIGCAVHDHGNRRA